MLPRLKNLEKIGLDLYNNKLEYEGISSLAENLSKCPKIKNLQLNLCWNKIPNEGIELLINSI